MMLLWSRHPRPEPFLTYSLVQARHYEAWYCTPAGRAVAGDEQAGLATMLATLPAHTSVLEVGCGTGYFTRWFATRRDHTFGVDPSAGMLAVAREEDGAVRYVRGAANALPFADASVDVVAFVTTLEFLAAPALALQEAARVARVGILLGVLNLASPLGVRRRVASLVGPSVYRAARFFTPWSLQRLLRRTLARRIQTVHWTTAVWSRRVPPAVQRLPFGGFIAMAVGLKRPGEGATPWST